MRKVLLIAALAMMLLPAASVLAADGNAATTPQSGSGVSTGSYFIPPGAPGVIVGACIGVGLVVIGAAKGVGAIGSHAVDAIARQPEAGGRIFTTMIISAALIEGFTLFAVVVCLLASFKG